MTSGFLAFVRTLIAYIGSKEDMDILEKRVLTEALTCKLDACSEK